MRKTIIEKKLRRKTNPYLVKTIIAAKKKKEWLKIADLVSRPKRKQTGINLDEIDKKTKEGDTIVFPGKILGKGEVTKKIRIAALYFSDSAREKLRKTKSEAVSIIEEIKKNPVARGVKILIK